MISEADLEIARLIKREAGWSITHKCHDEGECDCDRRHVRAAYAQLWLLTGDAPFALIGEMLVAAMLPESVRALIARYPDAKVPIPPAAWERCKPAKANGHWVIRWLVLGQQCELKLAAAGSLGRDYFQAVIILARAEAQNINGAVSSRLVWLDEAGTELESHLLG